MNSEFNLAANGYDNHAAWADHFAFARSSRATFLGSRDESAGNQTAQYNHAGIDIKWNGGAEPVEAASTPLFNLPVFTGIDDQNQSYDLVVTSGLTSFGLRGH